MLGGISVIVPVLNESAIIAKTLGRLRALGDCELVVVDGGSADSTPDIARGLADISLVSERGRGTQMLKGAQAATGDILIFAHADCALPEGAFGLVREALSSAAAAACAFDIRIDAKGLAYRIIERGANLRSRLLRAPYGDQTLSITREAYERAGGHPQWRLMEDIELGRRLRRSGGRMVFLRGPVVVSSRRWKRHGIVRTTLLDWALGFAHAVLGVRPERLARFYGNPR